MAASAMESDTDSITLVTEKETTPLENLVFKFNGNYHRRRYLSIVHNKEAHSVSGGTTATIKPLTPPLPIRAERSRPAVERFLTEARHNRAPECRLYIPSEGKFLCVTIDTKSGKHYLRLLEGDRMWPTEKCGIWRAIPADRTSKDKLMLLQNCFSNRFLGHDIRGLSRVDQALPTKYEHLELVVDEETGFLKIICPHYAWETGAPFVLKGPGKRNPKLWSSEVKFLEWAGNIEHSENPHRTLRCGSGGRKDKSSIGYVPALFQVVWDLPEQSKRVSSNGSKDGGAEDIDLNWLGQNNSDYSYHKHKKDPNWRSPYKARVLGLLP